MTDQLKEPNVSVGRWLESLKPSSAVFWRAEATAPWGVYIDEREAVSVFHVIMQGSALLALDGLDHPVQLRQGDFVLFPSGLGHALSDARSSALPTIDEVANSCAGEGKWVRFGGGGEPTVILCGGCHLGTPHATSPTRLLPAYLKYSLDAGMTQLLEEEAGSLRQGMDAVLIQLLTLFVLQALRVHLTEGSRVDARALLVPDLGGAVKFIHENLGNGVHLDDICRHSALSRTVLSQRFRDTLGVSPIAYVRLARLSHAADLLRGSRLGLSDVARTVGYSSASTFSRAFRQVYGRSPGDYRTGHDQPSPDGARRDDPTH